MVRPASAGDCYLSGYLASDCGLPLRRRIHARVWLVACLPLLREWRTATSRYPFLAVGFQRACAGLVLPRPLGACRSTLHLFTGWFLLAVVVSS